MNLLTRMSVWALSFIAMTSTAGHADPAPSSVRTGSPAGESGELTGLSDSGIYGPPYAEIVKELDSLARAYPARTERIQYGTTVKGRPLVALRIGRKDLPVTEAPRQAIVIAGSIHGNEYLNVEDRLPRWFLEAGAALPEVKKFFDRGGVALLAPILNPDGYEARKRESAAGVDLNRDFTVRRKGHFGFKQPETKSLSEFIGDQIQQNSLRLALTMDYHCCIGAILRPWGFKTNTPPREDLDRFDVVGRILKSTFGSRYQYGTTPEVLGYSSVGTSKDHYYETYGAVGLTFEGKKNSEAQRFDEHTAMWEKILAAVNAGKI